MRQQPILSITVDWTLQWSSNEPLTLKVALEYNDQLALLVYYRRAPQ